MTTPLSPNPRRWQALAVLCTAQFLVILDTSIVGVALPALQHALDLDAAGLQWIFNAYVVAFGGLLLLGGRLSDRLGPRRVFAAGFTILAFASLVAGLASSGATLLAARAIQGIGAALIAPAALTMLMRLFGGQPGELRRAFGFWGASAAAGGTAGVFLGGVITEWLSWRWTFLVNVPIAVAVLAFVPLVLPAGRGVYGRVGLGASLAMTMSIGIAVYATVTANDAAASASRTMGFFALAGVLFAVSLIVQRLRGTSLVPADLLRARGVLSGNVVVALLGAAWIPMWFFLNLYLQQILGYGALASGLALLPMTVTIMVLMVGATEGVVRRIGPRRALIAGLVTLGGALVLFARMPVDGTFSEAVLVPSLLAAVGMSLAYIPGVIGATASAQPEHAGIASGLVNTTYQLGSALGLALMTAFAAGRTADLAGAGVAATVASNGGFAVAHIGAASIAFAAALVAVLSGRPERAHAAEAATSRA